MRPLSAPLLSMALAAALVLAPAGLRAQIVPPGTVDPRETFVIELETPAGPEAELRLRRLGDDGPGAVLGRQTVREGARRVQVTAPGRPGSYRVELVDAGGPRGGVALEVAGSARAMTSPDVVRPGDRFEVLVEGVGDLGDEIEIVRPDSGEILSRATVPAGDSVVALTAPDVGGPYEIRYVERRTGTVLGSHALTVDDARVWMRVPLMAAPGERVRVEWHGPGGASRLMRLLGPDGTVVSERTLAGFDGPEGTLEIAMPGRAAKYRLRYINLATDAVLSEHPIIVR